MEILKAGPKRGVVPRGFNEGGQVDHAVGIKEKHGDHRGHDVEGLCSGTGPEKEDGKCNHSREDEAASRFVMIATALGKEPEPRQDAVFRQRLEDAWRPHIAANGARERRGHHPGGDEEPGPEQCAILKRAIGGINQGLPIDGTATDQNLNQVHQQADADGQKRPTRNTAPGIRQVAGHVDAGQNTRHGRKVDGETHPEGEIRITGCRQVG